MEVHTLLWVMGACALALVIRILLSGQPLGRDRRRSDAQHFVRSLLVLSANGGNLRIERHGSKQILRVWRDGGDAVDVALRLELPDVALEHEDKERLHTMVEAQDLPAELECESETGEQLALKLTLVAPDIWEESCGAKMARVIHLILDALDVESDARLDYRLEGKRKIRIQAH